MSASPVVETLRDNYFLAGMSESELQWIASVARLEKYAPEAVIFWQGEEDTGVFLVVEGTVSLEIHVPELGARCIQTVGPGELVGWSPLLGEGPMTATARAQTPVLLVGLNSSRLLELCRLDPKLGFTLMRQTARALATRLHATRLRFIDVYGHALPVAPGIHEGAD
jgi:CRP/FNR family cyclic AMP-dependent transcriptional regulator